MFVETRDDSREFFLRVWRKMGSNDAMEPLEMLIAQVITEHPEFHATLENPAHALEAEYASPDQRPNPFLHMGLHIALVEQLQTDRPQGIRVVYQRLLARCANDAHSVQHRMIDCLAQALYEAGDRGGVPDQDAYLAHLQRLSA